MDNFYHHLRFDVRKVQEYIFRVPKLKYMLGANSSIGELFSKELIGLMPQVDSIFNNYPGDLPAEIKKLLDKNILSSAGGHFEAVFDSKDKLDDFAKNVSACVREKTPGLEVSMSSRKFLMSDKWKDFYEERKSYPLSAPNTDAVFIDAPFYQLCKNDGQSIGMNGDKGEILGSMAKRMSEQADDFYRLKNTDAISTFYQDMKVSACRVPKELGELSDTGVSLKRNMLAYIKADGNGTGARFNVLSKSIDSMNIQNAFIEIEKFWYESRTSMMKLLEEATRTYIDNAEKYKKLPFILLMLGGDDLFMVSTPEIALDIAKIIAKPDIENVSVSVGIAFVKETYPVASASAIAEMCLESAKAAGYAQKLETEKNIIPYIDWHVHFDSVYQHLKDIRRASYMLNYKDGKDEMIDLLSKRPYRSEELSLILKQVKAIAKKLDKSMDNKKTDNEIANNKIKTYRSALKNGYRDLEYLRERLMQDDALLNEFLVYEKPVDGIRLDASLDKIELIDFYRTPMKEGAQSDQD